MIFGNHDRIKENSSCVWKSLESPIPFYESVIIDSENGPPIFMFHGYQGDFINDKIWKVSRWLVRYLWKPLEIRGVNDPTSAAKELYQGAKNRRRIYSVQLSEKMYSYCGSHPQAHSSQNRLRYVF